MQTSVELSINDDIGTLTFHCDEAGKPNTLDYRVLNELEQHLRTLETMEHTLRAVIIESAYPKYFIVGANINALKELNTITIEDWVRNGHRIFNHLERLPLPVIARVEGYALGGGLELAMACDFIFSADTAKYGQPEANLGVVSGWGGSYRLPLRVGLARAKQMFYTAEVIDAQTAYDIHLVDFVGNVECLSIHIEETIKGIRRCSALAVKKMKALLNQSLYIDIIRNGEEELKASVECMADESTMNRISRFLRSRN